MGLIDFMKNAGANLFGGDDDKEVKKENLIKHVKSLGLPVDNLQINVDDDVVKVSGKVDSAAHAEKIALALGNVEGVSKVDNKLEVEQKEAATPKPEAPKPRFYQVESGDSLSKIAEEYYGDPKQYNKIFEANQPMLKDPNEIYPGQMLRIPHE